MTATVERRNPVRFYRDAFAWRAAVLKRALRRKGLVCDDDEVNRELRDAPDLDAAYVTMSARHRRLLAAREPSDNGSTANVFHCSWFARLLGWLGIRP